jgi:signal transduction histidine kinase
MVNTDPHYLQIMIRNVVENALRFSPDGEMVTLRAASRDDGVEISVKDHGIGINGKELSRVFQPFARIEDVDKHQRGIGLGLYIVQHIARLLGIDIRVDSQSGEGTVLSFKLPSDLESAGA